MSSLLRTEGLTKHFAGLVANESIDFELDTGSIQCVIGPNGAGKTTFISMISGHLEPDEGRVIYKDRDITNLNIVKRARIGIARKFQTPTVFDELTAYENIELAVLGTDCPRKERQKRIIEVLKLIHLTEESNKPVKFLSHGQRQWLEIGLLLAVKAELLLLDEPTAGMTVEETVSTANLIKNLTQEFQLSVIIIEHDINFIRDLNAPVTVLHLGRVLMEGTFDQVSANEQVREIYLGHGSAHIK
ncbi:MAG: ATP-binding cassette domain-containing protein [Gammaproteobacteria bacterium]